MATPKTQVVRWSNVRGLNVSMNPDTLPEGLVTAVSNVELLPGCIGRRRPALNAFTHEMGANQSINSLFRFIGSDGIDSIWYTASGASELMKFRKSGATTTASLGDAASSFDNGVQYAALNNKLFIAYDSSVNRLHVYDGTSVRRVGINKPAAATVADTGAGAYAATARRYRISQRIISGSDVVVESELSDAVEFTPSGAGTAARVTKPATVDSATHWVVWGLISTAGDTYDLYKNISGNIAVGTTTYDDSVNPASYSGDAPAQLGLHIPPPAARFLVTDGNRLLMAGAFETSAAAGQTVPKTSRVWFTRVLGSSDIGDDETIPNTTTQKNWIDVGEGDGDSISGLAGPIDGKVFVFKTRSVWELQPTGDDVQPYTAACVTRAVGAYINPLSGGFSRTVSIIAEDTAGQPSVYFCENEAIYRLSLAGLERVSEDLTPNLSGDTYTYRAAVFWPERRMVLFLGDGFDAGGQIVAYTPRLAFRDEHGTLRGGWSRWDCNGQFGSVLAAACLTIVSGRVVPLVGGADTGGTGAAGTFDAENDVQQDADCGGGSATAVSASITSAPFTFGNGINHVSVDEPVLEAAVTTGASPVVKYVRNYGEKTVTAPTAPSLSAVGSETRVFRKVQGLELADCRTLQVTYEWDGDQYGVAELTGAIEIPYRVQERV